MGLVCSVGGTEYLAADITFNTSNSGHSTASVLFTAPPYGQFWDTLIVSQDGTRVFEGLVIGNNFYSPDSFNSSESYHQIRAVGYSAMTKYRTVTAIVESKTAAEAITQYILPVLALEGVTAGTIEGTWVIDRDVWGYMYIYDVMEKLLKASPGYIWYIDFDKKLHYYKKTSGDLEYLRNSDQFTQYNRDRDFSNYRNVQHAIVSSMRTGVQNKRPASPSPDGTVKTYTVNFGIAEEPTIYINDVAVDSDYVGVNGIDDDNTDIEWLWSYGSDTITQVQSETALSSGTTLTVTYIGLRSGVVSHSDYNKINERQSNVPGTSGLMENTIQTQGFETIDQVSFYVSQLISTYGATGDKLSFNTLDNRFTVGKRVRLNARGETSDLYVDNVSAVSNGVEMEYTVTCYDSAYDGGTWEEYFYKMIVGSKTYSINSTDTLYQTIAVPEDIGLAGEYTLTLSGTALTLPFTLPAILGGSDSTEVTIND